MQGVDQSPYKLLSQLKRKFSRGKTKIMCISICWKIVLTLCIMPIIMLSPNCGKECIDFLFISTTQKNGPSIHNDILNTQFIADNGIRATSVLFDGSTL
jgi:hypothetical protein